MLALRTSGRAKKPLLATAALAAALASMIGGEREADASGYLTARFGSDHGTPATPNAFAIYFNPAALGGTTGTTITGDVSLALRWVHYKRGADGLSPSPNARNALLADQTYIDANTGDANLLNLLALPFLGVNTDFGGSKYLRAGYAVYVPFGGLATWDKKNGSPGAPGQSDGVQRWHNIAGQILAIYNTFAFAARLGESGFSLGASVSPVIHHVATVRARTADDSDDIYRGANKNLYEGRSYLNASGVNLAASIGAYWQLPDQRVRVGLAYLAQPGFGETRLNGTLDGRTAGGDVSQKIDFLQSYPDIVRLGATFRVSEQVELRSDIEFVRWSLFDKQCVVLEGKNCDIADNGAAAPGTSAADIVINIPRKWNNAWGYRLGGGYFVSKELELFAGAAFTTSAVPKETIDASTIDSFRLYGTLGARYEISKKFALAGSYNHIYFVPVNTDNRNIFDTQEKPSKSPSADGKYDSQIGFLNVNVSYTF